MRRQFAPGYLPPGQLRLIPGHPLARGLVAAYVWNNGGPVVELIRGLPVTTTGGVLAPAAKGQNWRNGSTSSGSNILTTLPPGLTTASLSLVFRTDTVVSDNGFPDFSTITTPGGEWAQEMSSNAPSGHLSLYPITGQAGVSNLEGGIVCVGLGPRSLAVTLDGATVCSYVDAVLDINASMTLATSVTGLTIGNRPSALGSRALIGGFYHYYVYNRPLSAAEIAQSHAAPYDLWEPVGSRARRAATAGGSSKPIAEAIASTSLQTAALGRKRALAEAIAATSAQTAALGRRRPIAEAIASTSLQTVALGKSTAGMLAEAITSTSSVSAALGRRRALAEAIASTSLQTAALGKNGTKAIAEAIASTSLQAATLGRRRPIAQAIGATSLQTVALGKSGSKAIAASITASSLFTAALVGAAVPTAKPLMFVLAP